MPSSASLSCSVCLDWCECMRPHAHSRCFALSQEAAAKVAMLCASRACPSAVRHTVQLNCSALGTGAGSRGDLACWAVRYWYTSTQGACSNCDLMLAVSIRSSSATAVIPNVCCVVAAVVLICLAGMSLCVSWWIVLCWCHYFSMRRGASGETSFIPRYRT